MSKAFGDQDVDVKQIENVGALISVALVKEGVFALGGGAMTTFTVIVPARWTATWSATARPTS
jgi:preprotein translocase subunit SecF